MGKAYTNLNLNHKILRESIPFIFINNPPYHQITRYISYKNINLPISKIHFPLLFQIFILFNEY